MSTVRTNGKVEPAEWRAVRAERAGMVVRVLVERGETVAPEAPIAEIDASGARAALAAAEARIEQAKAELAVLDAGGRASEIAAAEGDLAEAELEAEAARAERDALRRLAAKQAATAYDLKLAADRVAKAEARTSSLRRRRESLVSAADRAPALARLRQAEADAAEARRSAARSLLRSPLGGVVYRLEARPGLYLNPGGLAAEVGRLDRLAALIYVDEPELGRVGAGMPVTLTWDALPGRSWQGTVESVPTEVIALGTRQVGEVRAVLANRGGELPPGANVNAEIRSRVAEGALTIPKEALRREGGESGVWVLDGNRVAWRRIEAGVSSLARVEVASGLREGDAVALPAETALRDGAPVRPLFP